MYNLKNTLDQPVGIIGSGAAALITAHVLLRDGFTAVQLLTRDASPGGVWAKSRVYPGLRINKYAITCSLLIALVDPS
jgi:dimethylaniline monooxygenase (N-oxide forming)